MNVAVCVGFRPRNDHEAAVLDWVRRRWEPLGWPVHIGDTPGAFNRSAARNAAARNADPATDVLVFANADTTYLHAADMVAAAELAAAGGWVLSDVYVETSEAYTSAALTTDPHATLEDPLSSYERQVRQSPAGYQVVPAAWFRDVGGWDEGFGSGWGWEDAAFRDALDVLHAPHARIGWAVHLWHPRGPELAPAANRANRLRWFTMYRRAAAQKTERRRVAAMRAAVARP